MVGLLADRGEAVGSLDERLEAQRGEDREIDRDRINDDKRDDARRAAQGIEGEDERERGSSATNIVAVGDDLQLGARGEGIAGRFGWSARFFGHP
uniref:Unannotated protein n=1 Tax=freshwater metagenome TaxID=449393 RepID=A0A6J6A3G2_9ZZZZ